MADNWIKMRCGLTTHPKVVRIVSALCPQKTGHLSAACPNDVQPVSDKLRVVGGLHALWSIFDTHSEDGILLGYTPEIMDSILAWEGFTRAVMAAGWLMEAAEGGLQMPDYQSHNGQSAKRRAEDQKRKKRSRATGKFSPQTVLNLSVESRTKNGLEIEIEKDNTPIVPKGTTITPQALAFGRALTRSRALFRMRDSTPLDSAEERAWKKNKGAVAVTTDADWQLLEWWFDQATGKNDLAEYRKRSLTTLLNNWNGEIEKARSVAESHGVNFIAKKKEGGREPEGWRELLAEAAPDMHLPTVFGELPESVREWAWALWREKKKGGGDER